MRPLLLASAVAALATAGFADRTSAADRVAIATPSAVPASDPLLDTLARSAPRLDRKVLQLATRALACAMRQPHARPATLSVIDYSLPSTQPRLWVFDLARNTLLFEEWVAHGRNTGENLATRFSNREGSFMSSLGVFLTQETYHGQNGYSLRLQGLEPGFNDRARERAIVIHGAPYVNPLAATGQGRLGRSLGCPAVRPAIARQLIDTIRDGSLVFAYYPDADWLRQSQLLDAGCGGTHHTQADVQPAHAHAPSLR
ncbi:murein L,D-transpeptidase catalytic domain family protein [Luteimonas sp. XNQY3]|nr:murein L,D-transpeptidase catalytic domain family protein [Luteimonas sp. XNQY3]MCD9006256.1 murein L,D-transpeptidase catalytic domain family protein [Luteimonas sp. XNQY3]